MKNQTDISDTLCIMPDFPALADNGSNTADISLLISATLMLNSYKQLGKFMESGSSQKGLVLCALSLLQSDEDLGSTSVKNIAALLDISTSACYATLKDLEAEGRILSFSATGRSPTTYYLDQSAVLSWHGSKDGKRFDKTIVGLMVLCARACIPERYRFF